MNIYKTGLIRVGAYLLLGGMLTIPVSCDRNTDNPVRPTATTSRSGRLDQAGCGGFTNGKFLGTWTVTGSRLQVLINDNKQYVAQIFGENEFYIRGREFLRRGDIAGKAYSESEIACFEGDPGDQQGFSVSSFQPPAGFEAGPSQNSYRVSCSPRFNPNANSGDRVAIAYWTSGNDPVEARFFRGRWWVVQNVSDQFYRDAFIIRGRNMLIRSDVINFNDPWDIGRRYCFGGEDTGTGGLESPSNSPFELVPEGYTKGTFPDGSPYFVHN
ncbi:hypothetical protein ACAW74_26510 [Fibrella sp. WM1]|uniref:hypothetical protein n=1 Tax=Fibrella musci TaxID=3242485 RepID=UPI0035221BE6